MTIQTVHLVIAVERKTASITARCGETEYLHPGTKPPKTYTAWDSLVTCLECKIGKW